MMLKKKVPKWKQFARHILCYRQLIPSLLSLRLGQLIELAGEGERYLIILIVHRGAGIRPDVERLVGRAHFACSNVFTLSAPALDVLTQAGRWLNDAR
jgi:hypothetical protein